MYFQNWCYYERNERDQLCFNNILLLNFNLTLTLVLNLSLNLSMNIYCRNKIHLFDALRCFKTVKEVMYINLLHLFLAAILDAILDFSTLTNIKHFILLIS